MKAKQLEQLAEIVALRKQLRGRISLAAGSDMDLLLELLESVARTAARHYDPEAIYQDGEIDALAIIDTITGENHIRPGVQPS